MGKLEQAIGVFLGASKLTEKLARILAYASQSGTISYQKTEEIAGEDAEDALLLGWEWKLLIPVRTSRCGEWDDRILMAEPGEAYEMPNVARLLVEHAVQSGEWSPDRAIEEFFRLGGEPQWDQMPALVAKMRERCPNSCISAAQIGAVCCEIGFGERVDTMIAILKGAGVMSPKLGSLAMVAKMGSPLYELNPCLFIEQYGAKVGLSS